MQREELGRRAQAALIPHQGASRRQAELIAGLAQGPLMQDKCGDSANLVIWP
jgi:hypothetical protein